MGRIRSAENFVRSISNEEAPLNTPDQALALMKIMMQPMSSKTEVR